MYIIKGVSLGEGEPVTLLALGKVVLVWLSVILLSVVTVIPAWSFFQNPNFFLAPVQKLVLRAFTVFPRVSRVLLAFSERLLANSIFGIVVSSTWVRLQDSDDCCDAPPYLSMKLFGQPWHEHVSTDPSLCYSRLVLPFSYDLVAVSVIWI